MIYRNQHVKAEGTFDEVQARVVVEAKLLDRWTGDKNAMTAADWKALRLEALTSIQVRSEKS